MTHPSHSPSTQPPTPSLTEAAIRAIVKDELAKAPKPKAASKWFHDASHSADASRQAAQAARDEAEFTTE